MTSRTNPQNFSFRPRDEEAENTSRQSEQSNPSTGFTRVDRDQQGDIASSGEDLSRRDSESWDPLLNSAGRDERREPPSSRYAFTHDQLAHPDE